MERGTMLPTQVNANELSDTSNQFVKSKLSGWDAIQDIPLYLRNDIKREFETWKASYPVDDLMKVDIVLDYDELVSSSMYTGKVVPGKKVPAGVIRINYVCHKAFGNLANRRSPVYISPRYPRKQELIDLLDKAREICSGWDTELLTEIEDDEVANFISNKFSSDPHTTIKELQPRISRFIENSLKQLYSRLDTAMATYTRRFRNGRRFGFYSVPVM